MSFELVVLSLMLSGITVTQESNDTTTSLNSGDISPSLKKLLEEMVSTYGYHSYDIDNVFEYTPLYESFFKAVMNESEEINQTGMTIVFPHVLLNEENGYNATSGKFTAPASGLYQFIAHACNKPSKRAAFAIIHEGKEVAQITVIVDSQHTCVSAGALVQMQGGEMVWVNSQVDGCYIYSSDHVWPSFNGALLKKE